MRAGQITNHRLFAQRTFRAACGLLCAIVRSSNLLRTAVSIFAPASAQYAAAYRAERARLVLVDGIFSWVNKAAWS